MRGEASAGPVTVFVTLEFSVAGAGFQVRQTLSRVRAAVLVSSVLEMALVHKGLTGPVATTQPEAGTLLGGRDGWEDRGEGGNRP